MDWPEQDRGSEVSESPGAIAAIEMGPGDLKIMHGKDPQPEGNPRPRHRPGTPGLEQHGARALFHPRRVLAHVTLVAADRGQRRIDEPKAVAGRCRANP